MRPVALMGTASLSSSMVSGWPMLHSEVHVRGRGASFGSPSVFGPSSHVSRACRSAGGSDRSFPNKLWLPSAGGAANHGGMIPLLTTFRIMPACETMSACVISSNGPTPSLRWHSWTMGPG